MGCVSSSSSDSSSSAASNTFTGADKLYEKLTSSEEYSMRVISVENFRAAGKIPRSNETHLGIELWQPGFKVCFISHRWWRGNDNHPHPDTEDNEKYKLICEHLGTTSNPDQDGMTFTIDATHIWIDFACIDQDSAENQKLGINSLFSYVAKSQFLLVPVSKSDLAGMNLKGIHTIADYGSRAWCRCEFFVFDALYRARGGRNEELVFACGTCDNVLVRKPVDFQERFLPLKGELTKEMDREYIGELQENLLELLNLVTIESKVNKTLERGAFQLDILELIRPKSIPYLFAKLNKAKSITRLLLVSNPLGDTGAQAVAKELVRNTTLRELNLGETDIGDAGALALAAWLAKDSKIEILHLYANQIGNEGGIALANALKSNKTLKQLELYNNKMGDDAAAAFLSALQSNKSLTKFTLRSNRMISDDMNKRLKEEKRYKTF